MPAATTFNAVLLETILSRLAVLFLSGAAGDPTAAREAARQMLACYNPETDIELRLAAEIISFSLHALEALSQAATAGMKLAQVIRLRGSAVNLSRESHRSQRRLDQLQAARRGGAQPQTSDPVQPARPRIDKAIALIEATREVIAAAPNGSKTWAQSLQRRQNAARITENLKKNQAVHAG